MGFSVEFTPLTLAGLPELARTGKARGWRYVQILAVNTETGVDLVYSFMKDGTLLNYTIEGVQKTDVVPSITNEYFTAFVCENEIHDLFGVHIEGIVIDFDGAFYDVSQPEPMTIISPEQQAAREKARKLAKAKLARERKAAAAQATYVESHPQAKPVRAAGPITSDDIAAVMETMAASDPERVARVRAALEAQAKKAAEEAAAKDTELQEKLATMSPEHAAKVRAALEKKAQRQSERATGSTTAQRDAEIEAKLAQLDPERAAKVRAALDAKARRETEQQRAQQQRDAQAAKQEALEKRLADMDPERAAKVRAALERKHADIAADIEAGADKTKEAGE